MSEVDSSAVARRQALYTLLRSGLDQVRGMVEDLRSLGLDGVYASPESLETMNSWGSEDPIVYFEELIRKVADCRHCGFSPSVKGRLLNPPPGKVRLLFVDEMPDRTALREGSAMGGEAGALLWKIVGAMKLRPDAVYVTHTRMCRVAPGQSSQPFAALPCRSHMEDAVRLLRPEMICALGERTAQLLTGEKAALHGLRGRFFSFMSLPLMVTHHPSDMLKDPGLKRETWEDVRKVMEKLDL
ncbi:uracil-DNA glycosylase [Desulfobotulus sp. H1]|uniref:Uracil-DNA glycosylase n=1 Tax=Desulfobotulus pelophilus TaxID=2823377 RepID=A0ABT3N8I8_9BACT|nr:uracil-DNA glycosylase [Desulfobotulus pelophilus]MCW7753774.1 uracil-DNA glycosylase [Desulfobotulus pelophilus]